MIAENRIRWYADLILYKVYANIAAEASRTYLSLAWWILEPLFLTLVYYVVFGLFLPFNREEFIPNLIIGVTVWQWFNRSVMNSTQSIKNASALASRIRINRLFMPFVGAITDSIKAIFILLVVLIILSFLGHAPQKNVAYLALIIPIQFFFILSVATWTALLVPFAQDLKNLITLLLFAGMLGSGVFYSVEQLPESMRSNFLLNPMAAIITAYRSVLLDGELPDLVRLFSILAVSGLILAAAVLFERRFKDVYTRLLVT